MPRPTWDAAQLIAETLPRAQSKRTAWILRQICHDWPDEETVQILSSVRAAMEPSSERCTLCLVEVCCPIAMFQPQI